MKMQLERESLELVRETVRLYFETRDTARVRALMDAEGDWIGIGGAEVIHGRPPERLPEMESPRYRVLDTPLVARAIDETSCVVSGCADLRAEDFGAELTVRVTATCHMTAQGLRLRCIHISLGENVERPPDLMGSERDRETLLSHMLDDQAARLAERDRDMSALLNNLPGGVVCCDTTPELNLIEFSAGFLDLYGYTREEVRKRFHDQFARMIFPEDLERAWPVVREQLSQGNTKEIEYRIRRKDGKVLWILDRGQVVRREDGMEYFYCILLDVTESREAREALRTSLDRHRIVMEQTNDIIFEWDIDDGGLEISNNWERTFGYSPAPGDMDVVCAEDRAALLSLRERILGGEDYGEAEIRIREAGGGYRWCRVRMTLQRSGSRRRVVGVIINIDDEKRRTQQLQRKAQRDALTGLYNKGAARELIERELAFVPMEERAALLILDIDDFKQVNDRYGHLGGDAVLADLAGGLQSLFRPEDILGRIGGDEFCVFLRGVEDTAELEARAGAVVELFHSVVQNVPDSGISGSVGIAVAPEDGVDFNTLFQNADVALYHAKVKGKNRYAFYEPGMDWPELRHELAASRSGEKDRIESEGDRRFDSGELADYVFRALYSASDIRQAIPAILEIVGRQYDVSRVYIYEVENDGRSVSNTFEWCAEGVSSELESLQHVPVDMIQGLLVPLRREGVLYCRNVSELDAEARAVLEPQDIRSTLQCAINDGLRFCGAVGFDECRDTRLWTQEQVKTLAFIADILGAFLMKRRAQESTGELMESLKGILDHQRDWIYVIDPESHEILYTNQATRDVLPGLELGARCYEAFYRVPHPCAHCPVAHMDARGHAAGRVHSAVLDMDVEVRADTITWPGNRQVYLLSCSPAEPRGEEHP